MKKILSNALVILIGIMAAFFVFVVFIFLYDSYQKQKLHKIEQALQIESINKIIIGSWVSIESDAVVDKKHSSLLKIKLGEYQNCEFSYIDHSECGTYSLDLDSIFVEIKQEGSPLNFKRFSFKYLLIAENGIEHLIIVNSCNYSGKYKKL